MAQTSLADAPSTSERRFWFASGLGLGTMDQVDPFHVSINVCAPDEPTAHAFVVEKVLTAASVAPDEPGGVGLDTTLQDDPFHRSVSGPKVTVPPPRSISRAPTAQTSSVALPSTPLNCPASVGVPTRDQ